MLNTDVILEKVLGKARFWEKHRNTSFNERQQLLLNKLIDNFEGKLTSSEWVKIAKCSADTALRDIQNLMSKGEFCRNKMQEEEVPIMNWFINSKVAFLIKNLLQLM